jgi:hypothetical protein
MGTEELRLDDVDWLVVVAWFVALNVLDLGLTLHLIEGGAVEMNPIMRSLLDAGWLWAVGFKAVLTVGVAAGLWLGRRHQLVRRVGVAFVTLFVAIIAYELIDIWIA